MRPQTDSSFREKLRALVLALAEHSDDHQRFLALLLEGEHKRNESRLDTAAQPMEIFEQLFKRAKRLVDEGLESGSFVSEGADIYPAVLIGMLRGLHFRKLCSQAAVGSLKDQVDEVVEFFFRGAGAHR